MVLPPRRLIVWFLLVLLLPAAVVVTLGIRLIEQDRVLEARSLREERENAGDRVVAALEQRISSTEHTLTGESRAELSGMADDAIVVAIEDGESWPKGRLLYHPTLPRCPPEESAPFAAAEEAEFRLQDYGKAASVLQGLATSPDAGVRAGALLRLARNLRKSGRIDQALTAYAALAKLQGACLSGLPADLVARRAGAALLAEQARSAELTAAARQLGNDLLAGRWRVDRGTYQNSSAQLNRWLGAEWKEPVERETLAEAVDWIWRARGLPSSGRRDLLLNGAHITVLWQTPGPMVALVAGPHFQRKEWFSALAGNRDVSIVLAGEKGEAVLGSVATSGPRLQRASAETGLPWTVSIANADGHADRAAFASRRRLLLGGLLLVALVVAGASYFILQAVSRELAVSQLQSNFVAAVSHEFRTPLTTLRQFTEILSDNEDFPQEKRRSFYQAQARATDRLQHLVESLLDFGRMEAGKQPYRLERQPAAPIVRRVVDEFERETAPRGFTLEREVDDSSGAVDADRDALGNALWNLLDNAVKYSGYSHTIQVSVGRRDGAVAISVSDRGLGIPEEEQREIFGKFVRGAASRTRGIKGTGIGLAIVKHIVDAHGGQVRVRSAPGEGSTFTILLPGRE